jgi:flagellar motor switch protein FliM
MKAMAAEIRPHDFSRSDLLDRLTLSALQAVLDSFCRYASITLASSMRQSSHLSLDEPEQVAFSEFMSQNTDDHHFVLFALPPLPGTALLRLNRRTVATIVDLRLGGDGSMIDAEREPTDIDCLLIAPVLQSILDDLPRVLSKGSPLRAKIVAQERNPQLAQITDGHQTCLSLPLRLSIGTVFDERLSACIPVQMVKKLAEDLRSQLRGDSAPEGAPSTTVDRDRVLLTPVEVTLRFPEIALPTKDVARLEPGMVLQLGHGLSEPLELEAEGIVIAKAALGATERRRLACRVTEEVVTK